MPSSKYTFLDFAVEVLKSAAQPMTFQEIWSDGQKSSLSAKLVISGTTPWQTLGARLFVDIRDNPKTSFMKVGRNPARFWLLSRSGEVGSGDVEPEGVAKQSQATDEEKLRFHERKLHPLLAYYAGTPRPFNRGRPIYTKTVRHEKSKHSGLNEWVHPDMVGFSSPIENWNDTLLDFNNTLNRAAIRLYSFELKKTIDATNYREYFFQAVSNSSWANEGYLVACTYDDQDADLRAEMGRLSASFGIGIIILKLDDIDSDQVLFPARPKDYLDWETMSKLCDLNHEFADFIEDVKRDYTGKKVHTSEYDPIIKDPPEYIKNMLEAVDS
jgi:hypothetical protein